MSEEILKTCINKLDFTKLTAQNQCLCLDGTSGCIKTTTLNLLEQKCNRFIYKVQKFHNLKNYDTFPPALMGYISCGITDIYSNQFLHYSDRSPINPFDWWFLWIYLDKMIKICTTSTGSVEFDEHSEHVINLLEEMKLEIEILKNNPLYKKKRDHFNILVVIDSNYKRVDHRRQSRGEGQDVIRSNWGFYTLLQNIFYSLMYKDLCIDLAWFDNYNLSEIIEGLAQTMEYALNLLKCRKDEDICKYLLTYSISTPNINIDYTTNNIQSYNYRRALKKGYLEIIKED